jgi:hypothetical protein
MKRAPMEKVSIIDLDLKAALPMRAGLEGVGWKSEGW